MGYIWLHLRYHCESKVVYGRYMDVSQPAISCEHSARARKSSAQKRRGSCKGNTKWNYKLLLVSLFSVFPAIWGHVTLLFLLCYRACYGVVVLIYAFSLGVSLEVTTLVTTLVTC